jgi:hypothetical protein
MSTIRLSNISWTSINPLPAASFNTTASVISGKVYATGYQMNDVICYNPTSNTYSSCFQLTANIFKYLFENWLVSSGGDLYEFLNGTFKKCQKHSISFINLANYSSFRRNDFIYFIDWNSKLLRINTKTKSLEEVAYS